MKTKYYFSALAAASLFAACSNEELELVEQQAPVNAQAVVGADKVGNLVLSVGETETRAGNGTWEVGDKLGLAWFNLEGAITDTQTKGHLNASADTRIYANHLFEVNADRNFTTVANVYQGGHFVYTPYEYMSAIAEKTVKVNSVAYGNKPEGTVAKSDLEYDRFNNAAHLSPKKFIKALGSDATLEEHFDLFPMVNCVSFNVTPAKKFEKIGDLAVTGYQMKSTGTAFVTEYTIDPAMIPVDKASTNMANMDALAVTLAGAGTPATTVKRSVAEGAYTLADAASYPLYFLPVVADPAKITYTINVATENGVTGTVTVKNTDAALVDLASKLNTNYNVIRRNASKAWTFKNVDLDLEYATFALSTKKISNVDQWNDAVEVLNALGEKTAEFTITGEIKFTETPAVLTAPDSKITVKANGGKIVIDGDVTLTEACAKALAIDAAVPVVVNAKKTLTLEKNVELVTDDITNKGTIVLGVKSKIAETGDADIENADAEIKVVYGSYAYASNGIVSYEVPAKYYAYQIENLINGGALGTASVNTLVIANEFDINYKDTGVEEDPYTGSATPSSMPDLSSINVKLVGGSLVKKLTGTMTAVQNIYSEGTSTIYQVNCVELTNKGPLTIDAKKDAWDGTVDVINNQKGGSINITVNVKTLTVTTLNNAEGATATAANKTQVTATTINNDGTLVRIQN